jgi:hypothetical protein
MQEANEGSLIICTRNLYWSCAVAVTQENTAQYTQSTPPMS